MYPLRDWLPALLLGGLEVLAIVLFARVVHAAAKESVSTAEWPAVRLSAERDRGAVLQGGEGIVRVELTIGSDVDPESFQSAPADLVIVMDRSGSVSDEVVAGMPAALVAVADRLSAHDRMAFVSFASEARLHWSLDLTPPVVRKRAFAEEVAAWPRGGTELRAGLELALSQLQQHDYLSLSRAPRVVLISDGLILSNGAPYRESKGRASALARLGAQVSAVGIGRPPSFDPIALPGLADAGEGNFAYASGSTALEGILARELDLAHRTVAGALTVAVTPAAGVRLAGAAGYPLTNREEATHFRPGALHAGKERRFWLTFRVRAERTGERELGRVVLAYRVRGDPRIRKIEMRLPTVSSVGARAAYADSFDPDALRRSVAMEGLGTLEETLGLVLACHDVTGATGLVEAFLSSREAMSESIPAPGLDETLSRADGLGRLIRRADTAASQSVLAMHLIELGRLTRGR